MSRMTEFKQVMLDTFKKGKHVTAEELLAKLRKENGYFARATMYRNLAMFIDEGKVSRVRLNDVADKYELNCGKHYHLVCTECGKIENFNLPEPLRTPAKLMEYEITDHEFELYGVCPKCQSKR